jgi:hypothetical protein
MYYLDNCSNRFVFVYTVREYFICDFRKTVFLIFYRRIKYVFTIYSKKKKKNIDPIDRHENIISEILYYKICIRIRFSDTPTRSVTHPSIEKYLYLRTLNTSSERM